jgi:hypothetical protein
LPSVCDLGGGFLADPNAALDLLARTRGSTAPVFSDELDYHLDGTPRPDASDQHATDDTGPVDDDHAGTARIPASEITDRRPTSLDGSYCSTCGHGNRSARHTPRELDRRFPTTPAVPAPQRGHLPRVADDPTRLEQSGPLTARQARDLLGHSRVILTPVLDLPGIAPVDAYEIPGQMREAVFIKSAGASCFPYSDIQGRHQQVDHTIPHPKARPASAMRDRLRYRSTVPRRTANGMYDNRSPASMSGKTRSARSTSSTTPAPDRSADPARASSPDRYSLLSYQHPRSILLVLIRTELPIARRRRMLSSKFWVLTCERALKSFAQALLAIFAANKTGLFEADWIPVLSAALMMTLLSVLTSISGARIGPDSDPCVVVTHPTRPPARHRASRRQPQAPAVATAVNTAVATASA